MLDFFVCFSIHSALHALDVLSDLVGGQGEKYYYQEKNFEISCLYYVVNAFFSDFCDPFLYNNNGKIIFPPRNNLYASSSAIRQTHTGKNKFSDFTKSVKSSN